MSKVIILSGPSGAGKSRYAATSFREYEGHLTICSTDNFFLDWHGNYNFDSSKLGEAHSTCFREFMEKLDWLQNSLLVVDNTNTTTIEIAPYVLAAQAWKVPCDIITLMCANYEEVKKCWERNSHQVPLEEVMNQHTRLLERDLPPWWNHITTPVQF